MTIIILIISILVSLKTINYAIYEIKINNNISGGVMIIILATLSVILPTVIVSIR